MAGAIAAGPGSPRGFHLELVLVLFLCGLPTLYSAGYVWARLTHRLVWYGSFVARPDVGSNNNYSHWEFIFAPPSFVEEAIRNR